MAAFSLTDAFCYVAGHDFTTDINDLGMEVSVADLDVTTFGSSWSTIIAGTHNVQFSMSGFWQADGTTQVDDVAFADLGVADRVLTVGNIATEGEPCYIFQAANTQYTMFGDYGEAAPFTLTASGTNGVGVKRGQLALAKTASISSTGAIGSGVQVGAVGASEYLYATLHVFPTAGTTITIDVESDDNAGFTTATSRGTIGPITTTGGTWMTRVAGAITDDYFRFNVTAVTGSFTAAGAIAVGA